MHIPGQGSEHLSSRTSSATIKLCDPGYTTKSISPTGESRLGDF